jgi:hypothetical protein
MALTLMGSSQKGHRFVSSIIQKKISTASPLNLLRISLGKRGQKKN